MAYQLRRLCECAKCDLVQTYMAKNIWFHKSRFSDTLKLNGKVTGIINPRERCGKKIPSNTSYGNDVKPMYALWFSHGSWLFDPYCDGNHDKKNTVLTLYKLKILKIF